jgi:hypothetical protein
MDEQFEIDLEKKYGFKIIHRDTTEFDYLNRFTKHIVYFIIQDNELYYLTTNKSLLYLDDDITQFGLDPLSGHGIDYLEKDYQIAYHDERDKCVFTEELFKKFHKDGEYSINTENKLKRFYRKRKIELYFNSKLSK